METTRSTVCLVVRRPARRAYTLVEVMVVVLIIGVLAALAVPSYQRAVEQSRVDMAAANLRAIWSAERLYWIDYQCYTGNLGLLKPQTTQVPTGLGMLDPNLSDQDQSSPQPNNNLYFYYSLSVATDGTLNVVLPDGSHAVGTAQPTTWTGWSGSLTISDAGTISGSVSAGGLTFTPAFQ